MNPHRTLHAVIDPGGLDTYSLNQGQFRYVRDLLHGLETLAPTIRFTVFGGRPDPVAELAELFRARPDWWRYLYFPRPVVRGAMYHEQLRLTAMLTRVGADLYHNLHNMAPVVAPCPTIITIYDLMYELFPEYAKAVRSKQYQLYRWAARTRVSRAICISGNTSADVQRLWGVPASRLDVVYLGTTFAELPADMAPVVGVPVEGPLIVSPFNLEPRKNLAALVDAFARLLHAVPEARLVLYGRAAITPVREAVFERSIAKAGIGEAILRTGFLSDNQLGWLYRRATVFVFPSLYEGFGYPVLEAMASGACVVARGASAMAEILGDAGMAVETANSEEMAAAILCLLRDNERRAALGRSARDRAKEFSVRRMAEGTLKSYEQALGRENLFVAGGTR